MGSREDFQKVLENILGTRQVYFQPPSNVVLKYPCIVYEMDGMRTKYADNDPYNLTRLYTVTYIDQKPSSPVHDKLASLRMSSFDRTNTTDNLYHTVFRIYF